MGIPKDEVVRLRLAEQSGCEANNHSCNECGGCWCRQFSAHCDCLRDPETELRFTKVNREVCQLVEGDVIEDLSYDGRMSGRTVEIQDVMIGPRESQIIGVDEYGDRVVFEKDAHDIVETLEVPRELV